VTVLRAATSADIPALSSLIELSGRELSIGFYTPDQIEAAVTHVFAVDSSREQYVVILHHAEKAGRGDETGMGREAL
jgi:hypothetical protein